MTLGDGEMLARIPGEDWSLDDLARLREDVAHARRLGFGGKLCIHPRQVELINRGFAPTEAERAWASTSSSSGETRRPICTQSAI